MEIKFQSKEESNRINRESSSCRKSKVVYPYDATDEIFQNKGRRYIEAKEEK